MTTLLFTGALGGIVRGLVAYTKYQFSYKNMAFNAWYFTIIVGLSAVVGTSATWAISTSKLSLQGVEVLNPALAFIVGYAGGDFLESVYKLLAQKPTLSSLLDVFRTKK